MFIQRFKSKIHRATITEANLNYVGSITIDEDLLDAANIQDGELVQVVNINNGERLETYVIPGKRIRHCLFKWSSSSKSSSRGYRDHHFLCLHDSGGSERIFTDHNIPRSSKPVILIYLEKQPHKKRTAAYPFFISGGFDLVFCLSRTIHPVPQLLHGSGAS